MPKTILLNSPALCSLLSMDDLFIKSCLLLFSVILFGCQHSGDDKRNDAKDFASFRQSDTLKSVKDSTGGKQQLLTDDFQAAVMKLESIGFFRKRMNCTITTDSGYCCIVSPDANWLINIIEEINEDYKEAVLGPKYIKPVTFEGLTAIKQYFVVANYEVQERTYPRANIFEWGFSSSENAEKGVARLSRLTEDEWFYISKTPITWWRKNHNIYFIDPGGFFVLTEVPKIEKALKDNL